MLQTENPKEQRAKRKERAERIRERKIFGRNERREKFSEQISVGIRVGSKMKNIDFLTFTKCTVAFHFWKATVHFVKKFEDKEQFWKTAGAGFFVLISTNRDEEQFYTAAGDGLSQLLFSFNIKFFSISQS